MIELRSILYTVIMLSVVCLYGKGLYRMTKKKNKEK